MGKGWGMVLHLGPGKHACPLRDLGHLVLPLDGHEMDPCHPLHLFELLDLLQGEPDALFGLVSLLHPLEPLLQVVGDVHAGHELAHEIGHADVLHGGDPGQDIAFFRKAHVHGLVHEGAELVHVEDALGLDEVGPGHDLVGKPVNPVFKGIGKGVAGGPHEQPWGDVDLFAVHEHPLIPHGGDKAYELHGVDVMDIFRLGVVAEALVVPGEAEHVADAQGMGPEDVRGDGQAVPVPAHHLEIGLHAFVDQKMGGGQA